MAINIPSFGQEIQSFLPGMAAGLQNIVNPNMQQQVALRKAMLDNPGLAQHLADIGPQATEQIYGRGTGGLAPNLPVSSARIAELNKASALQEMLKLPKDDPARQYFDANALGIPDPVERATKALELKSQQDLAPGRVRQQAATLTNTELNNAELQKKKDDQANADSLGRQLKLNGIDPYNKSWTKQKTGQLTGAQVHTMMADPEFAKMHEMDFQDSYHQQEIVIRQQIADRERRGLPFKDLVQQHMQMKAVDLAMANGGDPNAMLKLLKTPDMIGTYNGMTDEQVSKLSPDEKRNYEAAQIIEKQGQRDGSAKMYKALDEFTKVTRSDMETIKSTDPRKEDLKPAALARINQAARQIYGPLTKDVPNYQYDDKGPGGQQPWYQPNTKVLYHVGGDPLVFGGEDYVSRGSGKVAETVDGFNVEAAARDVVGGNQSLGELLAKAPSKKVRDAIDARVKELTPAATSDTTGSARVKSALTLQSDTPNLNIGKDETKSIMQALATNTLAAKDVASLASWASTKDTSMMNAGLKARIDTMSTAEQNAVVQYLRRIGKIPEDRTTMTMRAR